MRRGPRIKPILTAGAVLILFTVAFAAFILAPLLMAVLVTGSMYLYERYSRSRRQSGVRLLSSPRSLNRSTRLEGETDAAREPSFGFGAGVGREL